ncbi:MAG: hypothetical protein KO202_07725 [Methanobacteriaceae archaeon]|jgi:hypothetical protein|nr:hypothetical protein [Methanobacteriaceae archaeon]
MSDQSDNILKTLRMKGFGMGQFHITKIQKYTCVVLSITGNSEDLFYRLQDKGAKVALLRNNDLLIDDTFENLESVVGAL